MHISQREHGCVNMDDDDIGWHGIAWHSMTAGTPGLAYVIWQLQI